MAAQSGNSGNGARAPFSDNGKPTNQGTGGTGGGDLVTDKNNGAITTGGPGDLVAAANRPQPAKKAQAGLPNASTIPAGGAILKADPGAVGKNAGGQSVGVAGAPTPFKKLK